MARGPRRLCVCAAPGVCVCACAGVCWESFVPVCVPCAAGGWWFAVKSSPCLGCLLPGRDNFLPARAKWSEMGVFRRVGRVLYRFGLEAGVAGGVLYRCVCPVRLVGGGLREKVLPAWVVCFLAVIIFSLLAPNGRKWAFFAVLGEFCTGLALRRGLLGEFCTGGCLCGGASAPLGGFTCALVGRGGHQVGYRCRQTVGSCASAPLICALTRHFAPEPAISFVGGPARARISGLTCELEGPHSYERVYARVVGPVR